MAHQSQAHASAVLRSGVAGSAQAPQTHRDGRAHADRARPRSQRELPIDFVADSLADGRRLRCFAVVDDFTRECVATVVDTSITGARVARELDQVIAGRCSSASITADNGPEFAGRVLDAWAYLRGIRLRFIRPGKPIENAYAESFNGRLRDKCLNEHWFSSIVHARALIGR